MGRLISIVVGTIVAVIERLIGSVTGTNRDLTVRFEMVAGAHTDTSTGLPTTQLEYVPVPSGTTAELHEFWAPFIPGPRLASAPVGEDGTVTFPQIWTGWDRRLYVSLVDLPIDPSSWDSIYLNFYHEEVRGVVPAGQDRVSGLFTAQQLIDSQVTFQVRGFPVHARITYSYGIDPFEDPFFRGDPSVGDPGERRRVRHVPIPPGIRVSLCRELPMGLAETLMRGRTTRGRTGIHETVWNAVLYRPLDLLPPSDLDPLKPATTLSLHVTMDLAEGGLGPIIAHSPLYPFDATLETFWDLPAIEVRSDPEQIFFDHDRLNLSLGTVEVPRDLNINPNSTQVGTLGTLAPADRLGHRAVFALQAISDVHRCFWSLGQNAGKDARDYHGVAVDVYFVDTLDTINTVSWPPTLAPDHPLWLAKQHWDVHSVIAHEFCHQISYERGLLSRGLPTPYWLTELPFHNSEKYTSPEIALLEGWAEFVEAEFGRLDGVGPIDTFWSGVAPTPGPDLWDEPGTGEWIEGCVARALFQAYKAVHDLNPIGDLGITMTTMPTNPGEEITTVHAFMDANSDSVADPGEPNLSDYFVEFLGANEFGLTNKDGEASLNADTGQVTGVSIGPARIVPAALTHTSRLDTDQAALLPLDPNSAPQCEGLFAGLFFDCWYPEVTNVHDLYTRMLESAHEVSPDFYDRINRIFWDNNMVVPHVASTGTVYRLADALSRPVAGTFPARVIQSANLLEMTGGTNDPIDATTATNTLNTNANGEIPADSLDMDPNTQVLVVDINIRNLMPRADAAGFDVWVRGRFPALH